MIERMKKVCLVASYEDKDTLLQKVRDLGVLHLSDKKAASALLTERFSDLSSKYYLLNEYDSKKSEKVLSDADFEKLDKNLDLALENKKSYQDEIIKLSQSADQIRQWGDFDPKEIETLKENGIELHFYKIGKKEFLKLSESEDFKFIRLLSTDKQECIAVLGDALDKSLGFNELVLPQLSLSALEEKINQLSICIEECEKTIKETSKEIASYSDQMIKCKNKINFSSASESSNSEDGLVWLCGYIPCDSIDVFVSAAKENAWAYLIDDPEEDDENVPTKVKYSKVSGLMEPVFGILGTVPGYHEYDISFWFLMFFTLFFAMIIGDAGYGFCFLGVAVLLHVKQKKLTNLNLLVYVVSLSTIIWGALTGTWFGLEGAMNVPLLKKMVIPSIANYPQYFGSDATSQQNSMMQFCFMLGTVQLTLACVMNVVSKLKKKDLSLVSDIGWLMSINALYYVVLLLVVNAKVNIAFCAVFIGLGFILVCLFGGMSPDKSFKEGLKSGLGDAFTNFLNTISAFGNIMSYIRLFAVGLASLAIAQSFNDMALGMTGFMKVFGVAIFIIGHALNLVMGLLSVIVHGVRLNLLEFSGQLNMEWSGKAYDPFRVVDK